MTKKKLDRMLSQFNNLGFASRKMIVGVGVVALVGVGAWVMTGEDTSTKSSAPVMDAAPVVGEVSAPVASTTPAAAPVSGPTSTKPSKKITEDLLSKSEAGKLAMDIADKVRSTYDAGQKEAPAEEIAAQIKAKLFPSSVVSKAGDTTKNPWGGTVQVSFVKEPLSGFSVEFTLPEDKTPDERRKICAEAVHSKPGSLTAFGGVSKVVPNKLPPAASGEGKGPLLTLIKNATTWKNITGAPVTQFFGAEGQEDCKGFAFVYRL